MPYMGKPNDIWSLGIVFYTMLFGHLPFYDPIPDRLFKKIQSAEFLIPK
jgi:serine/threonine protein kinase